MIWKKQGPLFWISLSGLFILGGSFFYKHWFVQKKQEKKLLPPPPPTPEEIYIRKYKEKFIRSFDEDDIKKYNQGIHRAFYVQDSYNKIMQNKSSILEKDWKQRILFEQTPQGYVIMYFDAYKHGFAYYSDHQITYPILCACCIKYVLTFFCRDFFIDETYWPNSIGTPFLRIHMEEKKENEKKKNKFQIDQGPFAKLKQTNTKEIIPIRKSSVTKKIEFPTPEVIKNKFVYLGKCANFSILGDKYIPPTISGAISYSHYKQLVPHPSMGSHDSLFC